jgi:hypothetical protein
VNHELANDQRGGVRVRLRRSAGRHGPPSDAVRASSEQRFQGCREARHGPVGTLAALVLGLLVASAKGSIGSQCTELTQLAANVVVLDRVLAHYGPEAKEARDLLRTAVARVIETTWPKNASSASSPASPTAGGE